MCGVNDTDLCVAICRFSQVVFVPSNNFTHNLLFYLSKHTAAQDDDRVTMKRQAIPRVKAHNHLGLKVTSTLSWSEHISRTRAKCAQRVGMIRKIRHLLPNHVLKRIYIAQVRSIMEYGCAVWSGDNISILQKLQDRFCRENHVKLPPVQARFIYLTLLLFYKIKNKLSPMYLERLLPQACRWVHRHTIICAVIIFRYQQWGRPVHWRPFFQDPSFCGMTCPRTSRHWELLRRLKLLLRII